MANGNLVIVMQSTHSHVKLHVIVIKHICRLLEIAQKAGIKSMTGVISYLTLLLPGLLLGKNVKDTVVT